MKKKEISLNEAVSKCAEDILNSKNVNEAIKDVSEYINGLEYSGTGKKIDKNTKKNILNEVEKILEEDNKNIIFESDNSEYLDVVSLISKMVGVDEDE